MAGILPVDAVPVSAQKGPAWLVLCLPWQLAASERMRGRQGLLHWPEQQVREAATVRVDLQKPADMNRDYNSKLKRIDVQTTEGENRVTEPHQPSLYQIRHT